MNERSNNSSRRNIINSESTNDINDFLQEVSTRDRLRGLSYVQNNVDMRNPYSNVNRNNTRFKLTLKEIVMVPYIENNKIVSKGSEMYVVFYRIKKNFYAYI
jgi:hypothetical protein